MTNILYYAILYTQAAVRTKEKIMNAQTTFMLQDDFKVWMCATLGLVKDGKMGTSQARADRIKAARTYTSGKGR